MEASQPNEIPKTHQDTLVQDYHVPDSVIVLNLHIPGILGMEGNSPVLAYLSYFHHCTLTFLCIYYLFTQTYEAI
jgi:hypothetical protein